MHVKKFSSAKALPPEPHGGGRRGLLGPQRTVLSSAPSCRFIPALACPGLWSPFKSLRGRSTSGAATLGGQRRLRVVPPLLLLLLLLAKPIPRHRPSA